MYGAAQSIRSHRSRRSRPVSPVRAQRLHRADQHAAAGAAWLAPSNHLSLPELSDVPAVLSSADGEEAMATLALAMIDAGLADVADWTGSAFAFLDATLGRWCSGLMDESDAPFGLRLTLSNTPGGQGGADDETGRFYLSVHPEEHEHTGIELGEAMAALAKLNKRLPAMFWSRFAGSLARLGFPVWDHALALDEEQYGWLGDMISEWREEYAAEDGEDECPHPMPSRAIPAYMKDAKAAGGTDEGLRRILKRKGITPGTWAGELLHGVLAMEAGALAADFRRIRDLTNDEQRVLNYSCQDWPLVITWFQRGDALTHVWDSLGESLMSSEEGAWPAAIWAFEATAADVLSVHRQLETYMAPLRLGARLVSILQTPPGPLPLHLTLPDYEVSRLEFQAATGQVRVRV